MRMSTLLLAGLALVALATVALRANDPAGGALDQAMQQMGASMKVLEKGVTAENHAAVLAELAKLESALIAAKAETPETAAKVEEKKRAAFLADYRKTLLTTLKLACDAEIAIADGKYKEAEALIRNKLAAQKSAGHGKFKGDEK